jgi:hypothetical protein
MKDPVLEAIEKAPNLIEVWDALTKRIEGMPIENVYTIGVNLIIYGIRMSTQTRAAAEFVVDDLFRRTKDVTLAHYDSVTGKPRALWAYTQMIQPPFHVNESKIFPPGTK